MCCHFDILMKFVCVYGCQEAVRFSGKDVQGLGALHCVSSCSVPSFVKRGRLANSKDV